VYVRRSLDTAADSLHCSVDRCAIHGHSCSLHRGIFLPRRPDSLGYVRCAMVETLEAWLVRFFSAFAAALIIVSCYFTAPAARNVVAWVVFAVGAVYHYGLQSFRGRGASLWPRVLAASHRCCY
jgi:hypothetical protein